LRKKRSVRDWSYPHSVVSYLVFRCFTFGIRICNRSLIGLQINIESTHLARFLPRQNELSVVGIQHCEITVKGCVLVSKSDEFKQALDDWCLNCLIHLAYAIVVAIDGSAFTCLLYGFLVILPSQQSDVINLGYARRKELDSPRRQVGVIIEPEGRIIGTVDLVSVEIRVVLVLVRKDAIQVCPSLETHLDDLLGFFCLQNIIQIWLDRNTIVTIQHSELLSGTNLEIVAQLAA